MSSSSTAKQKRESILRTKLHRPRTPADFLSRPRLHELLAQGLMTPLALVSAPAGYGKSLLVSHWVESREAPCAWLSLDSSESELLLFVDYLVAAVDSIFCGACAGTRRLTQAPNRPTLGALVASLINELDVLDRAFMLVLDDYHRIEGSSDVHELLRQLLAHPPRHLHLTILSRRDPPLGLTALRAKGLLAELRLQDLRFTVTETMALLERVLGLSPSDEAVANLERELEGWAVGLRLVSLAARRAGDPDEYLRKLCGGFQHTQEYLVEEVISQQAWPVQKCLLRTSVLDRFCPELCDALCVDDGASGAEISGLEFVRTLHGGNLFAICLDDECKWFRYHHLFQQLLRKELEARMARDAIARLYGRASVWFESQGFIEEAMRHALQAGDAVRAAEVLERHRCAEMDEDRWQVMQRRLDMLAAEIRNQRPALLLAQAWVFSQQWRYMDSVPLLDRVEALLADGTADEAVVGELEVRRGSLQVMLHGDGEGALRWLEGARRRISCQYQMTPGALELYSGLAKQLVGEEESAIAWLEKQARAVDASAGVYLSRVLGSEVIIHLLSAGLVGGVRAAGRLLSLARANDMPYIEGWAQYFISNACLQRFRLDEALPGFASVAKSPSTVHGRVAIDAQVGLVLTHQAMQRPDDAANALEALLAFARESGDAQYLAVADSCRARLALLQGNMEPAMSWACSYRAEVHGPGLQFWLEVPAMTQARILLANGSDAGLRRAGELLDKLDNASALVRNTYQATEIRSLQCLCLRAQGHTDEAIAVLSEGLRLARPSGWIRPFVEAGRPMAELIGEVLRREGRQDYVARILDVVAGGELTLAASTRVSTSTAEDVDLSSLAESLTSRELDILELLTQRLRNKQIASRLCISEETVKSHLKHVYQKLGVSSRRQAAVRAEGLRPYLTLTSWRVNTRL